jgi:hypothetical protein
MNPPAPIKKLLSYERWCETIKISQEVVETMQKLHGIDVNPYIEEMKHKEYEAYKARLG